MVVPEINPDAKNPHYEDPMRLGDAVRNMEYLIVDMHYGYVELVRLSSDWRIERDESKWPRSAYSLVADDSNGLAVDLCLHGIHPHPDGEWSKRRFAIRATDEKITELYMWLIESRLDAVAESLSGQYPRLTTLIGETFWQRVMKHLHPGTQ